MITIFTTPKPMTGKDAINQYNAIGSWLAMKSGPQVIVFTTENERHIFDEMGATVITTHRCNERGTPFLDSMFTLAELNSRYPYLMYSNADVIHFQDIFRATRIAVEHSPEFLIVGQRIDIEWTSKIDFGNSMWITGLHEYANATGTLVAPTGKDFFIFAKPFRVRMEPLLVGRLAWDTWLVREAHRVGLPIIDVTRIVTALHIKHDYSHLPGGRAEYAMGEGCRYNHTITQSQPGNIAGHITDSQFVITSSGVLMEREAFENL